MQDDQSDCCTAEQLVATWRLERVVVQLVGWLGVEWVLRQHVRRGWSPALMMMPRLPPVCVAFARRSSSLALNAGLSMYFFTWVAALKDVKQRSGKQQ